MGVYYGAAYYPEQWPERMWETDIRLMKEAGLNATRIGEFAWTRMEPSEGKYDWAWLDRVMALLAENEIGVVLCTPSAAPPMWVTDACPGMSVVDINRTVRPTGGRRNYCPNNIAFRNHCKRIVAAMAERYANHPALIGWQTDNEFGQENTGRCCCDTCAAGFREWLKAKYGSLEVLNEAWGTVFWSAQYDSWQQVEPPMQGVLPEPPPLNPQLRQSPGWILDYERFQSDSYVEFQKIQVDQIRLLSGKPITHNTTGISMNKVDYYDLFKDLDMGGLDCYPSVVFECYSWASLNLSQSRCLTGKPPWILEMSSGGGVSTWGGVVPQPAPGGLRIVAWQVFANGGEMALHFQWRIMAKGAEQLESSILNMDGKPYRKYHEVKRVAGELKRMEPWLSRTRVQADVAIVWCYDHHWAHSLKPFSQKQSYAVQMHDLYEELVGKGLNVDVVSLQSDFSKYRAVVLASPILMTPEIAGSLKSFVDAGGVLLSTFLAGVKDWQNVGNWDRPLPGYLDDLFGVNVIEVDPGWDGLPTRISIGSGDQVEEVSHSIWTDILETVGPETDVIGRIVGSYRTGEPVITRNKFGSGCAYYLGTWPEQKALGRILDNVLADAGVVRSPIETPRLVEQVRRSGDGCEVTFLLNWSYAPAIVTLPGEYMDLIADRSHEGVIELSGRDVVALTPALAS